MESKKKSAQEIFYVLLLLAAIIILFRWYTIQSGRRMEERNKNYAADSARLMATQIDDELSDARNLINTYAYFLGKSLTEPEVSIESLKEMEENVLFDALIYTDMNGIDYTSDGRTADATKRIFYHNGIKGESGIEIIFDPYFFDETMACFYAPVYYQDELIGILRGAYLAKEYLKKMLSTTYFGEPAGVFLCMPDERVIADSNRKTYDKKLLDILEESHVIDKNTAPG